MKSISESLVKSSGIYAFGKILPKAVGILLLPIYTRFLTTQDYGIVSVVGVVYEITILILWMGLPASVTRYYFEYPEGSTKFRDFFGTVIIFLFIAGFAIILMLSLFGRTFFERVFSNISFSPYIRLILWVAFFKSSEIMLLSLYRAKEMAIRYTVLRLINFFLITGLIVYFIIPMRGGALGKIKGEFYGSLVFFIFYLILIAKEINFTFSIPKLNKALSYGLPLVPHALSSLILASSDRILLEKLSTLSEVGLYNVGYQIGMAYSLILSSIDYAWGPIYYKTARNEVDSEARRIFSRMTTLYLTFAGIFAAGMIIFSKEIIYIMTAPQYHSAKKVIPLVAIGYLLRAQYLMNVRSIFLEKKTYIIAPITIISAALNIGLNILWIPKHGMIGAAYATAISFAAQGLITHIIAQKIYYVPYEYSKIFTIFGLVSGVYFINRFVHIENFFPSLAFSLFVFLAFLSLLFLFRVISSKDMKKMINVFRSKT